MTARAPGDRRRREEGALEEHLGGFQRDPAVLAAHDARERKRARFVGDEQGIGRRGDGLLVEQAHLLARTRHAHVNRALQRGVVEGVQRLAELEHHVVGDVNQGADRADAAAREAAHHPVGRRSLGIDAMQDPPAVARTGGGRVEDDLAARIDRRRDLLRANRTQGCAGDGGHLAGDAGQTQAVGAIGRELDRKKRVVEAEIGADVGAHGRVVR